MSTETMVRWAAAMGLSAVAKSLAAGARLTEEVAKRVRGDGERGDSADGAVREPAGPDRHRERDGRGEPPQPSDLAVTEPPTEPVPDVPMHARTHETHAEELAARTAAEVIAAVPQLSTDELGRLYEQELATKRRKTVLEAIERSADPTRGQPVG